MNPTDKIQRLCKTSFEIRAQSKLSQYPTLQLQMLMLNGVSKQRFQKQLLVNCVCEGI